MSPLCTMLHSARTHIALPCALIALPQSKCGDAKALDLILNATSTGCLALNCAFAVDNVPLTVKLALNVRRCWLAQRLRCMPAAARTAKAAAALLPAARCPRPRLRPQGCAPTMALADTDGSGALGEGDAVKYCASGACAEVPFLTGASGWGACCQALPCAPPAGLQGQRAFWG